MSPSTLAGIGTHEYSSSTCSTSSAPTPSAAAFQIETGVMR